MALTLNKNKKTIMATFDPNKLTFEDGIRRIQTAAKKAGVDLMSEIFTSREASVRKLTRALETKNIPGGFTKFQLPVALGRTQLFLTSAPPNVKVPKHSHNDGAGVRFIVAGSITFNGQELSAGDWMFIPKGRPYQFEVGPLGATMFYCYECCCA
jgi:hypothetical protein